MVNHISVCLTPEAMLMVPIQLHARVPVVVKRTAGRSVSTDIQPEMFRRHSWCDGDLTASKMIIGISPFDISDKFLCQLNIRRKSLRPKKSGACAKKTKKPSRNLAEMQVRKGNEPW